ncbi:MAG: hypothetical protein JWM36_410 [Hyphomicrobiales bacterium]|nr:hypothetical protein [Hyphomicrobiales bacterium]
MSISAALSGLVQKIRGRLAVSRKANEFSCGDCSRNARCGLEPSENCVARAAQIADGKPAPRRTLLISG